MIKLFMNRKNWMLLLCLTAPLVLTACGGGGGGGSDTSTSPTSTNVNLVGTWAGTNNVGDAGWFVFSADNTFYSSDRGSLGTMSGSYSLNENTVTGSGTSTAGTTFTLSATVTGTTMTGAVNETYSGNSLPWSFNVIKQ